MTRRILIATQNRDKAAEIREILKGIDVDFPVTVSGTIGKHTLRGSARGGGPLLHVRTSSGGISIQ